MRLESMRNKLLGLLSLKYAVAVALVLVLAFGGALGATRNSLDGIQLVQETESDFDEGETGPEADSEAAEGGESEADEGGEESEYPPELGEGAEGDESEAGEGDESEAGEGDESEAGEGDESEAGEGTETEGPGPGDQVTVGGATPNRTFANAQVIDSEGNVFNLGGGTADGDGNVTFTIPLGAASGDATLRLVGGGPGGPEELDFDIATNRFGSSMVSLSIGAAILLVLGGVLFAVVRRRRAGTVA